LESPVNKVCTIELKKLQSDSDLSPKRKKILTHSGLDSTHEQLHREMENRIKSYQKPFLDEENREMSANNS
jgi:hypothetical protein